MWALFVPALMGALATAMGTLVGRAVLALGIGFVTYKGIDIGMQSLQENAIDSMKGIPAGMIGLMGYLWIDKAITVIFSAITVAITFKTIGGAMKRMTFK